MILGKRSGDRIFHGRPRSAIETGVFTFCEDLAWET